MIKFIYICMAITVFSFIAVPFGMKISAERDLLLNEAPSSEESSSAFNTQSFEEIYSAAYNDLNAEDLNRIVPASGEIEETFGNAFTSKKHSAL